ncbi:hypothetical protein FRC11_001917, partial [Ceratobasidium sp. 423]
MDLEIIISVTGLSERYVREIKAQWEETGHYRRVIEQHGVRGRPRLLDPGDVSYLAERITQAPDLFLDELKAELADIAGIEVSIAIVWRTLTRLGFTYKV